LGTFVAAIFFSLQYSLDGSSAQVERYFKTGDSRYTRQYDQAIGYPVIRAVLTWRATSSVLPPGESTYNAE